MELLSAIIDANTNAHAGCKNLAIPLSVATSWNALDLKFTATGNAEATHLPLHLLTLEETLSVSDAY